jgi:hypothetical protein
MAICTKQIKIKKIEIATMEEKINNLMVSMDLMFTYLGRYKYYDQLLKNEGNDKYIISVVHLGTKKEKIDVFRISEIKDPELKTRTYLLDQGYPVLKTVDDGVYIFNYLSEIKLLTENVGVSVRELLKNR